jgi:hypothetical protein
MAELVWDKVGERFYETGVKQGVLYPQDTDGTYPLGVAWNGLVSVTESPSGAEASPLYADDVKYLNLISAEEFAASIEAYTYPDEFAECDGSAALASGVYAGQQSRKAFGLVYKTTLGNDIENNDYGYKLHIIYGATASPSEKGYQSINDSPEAITFSWELNTTPAVVTGKKPTASIVIDSTKCDAGALSSLEDMLFGTAGSDPYLPTPDVIAALFVGGDPSAVALSSIVPADEATGVSRTANIVLTFNNAIRAENIVVTTAAGAIVSVTRSWDATGKILTLDPSSTMAATTVHIVAIAGVVDIYNQALAASVTNFTTGS